MNQYENDAADMLAGALAETEGNEFDTACKVLAGVMQKRDEDVRFLVKELGIGTVMVPGRPLTFADVTYEALIAASKNSGIPTRATWDSMTKEGQLSLLRAAEAVDITKTALAPASAATSVSGGASIRAAAEELAHLRDFFEPHTPAFREAIIAYEAGYTAALAASPASVTSPQEAAALAPTRTMEVQGDGYSLNDVLEYLEKRSGNPLLEAAHEFLVSNYRLPAAPTSLGVAETGGAKLDQAIEFMGLALAVRPEAFNAVREAAKTHEGVYMSSSVAKRLMQIMDAANQVLDIFTDLPAAPNHA